MKNLKQFKKRHKSLYKEIKNTKKHLKTLKQELKELKREQQHEQLDHLDSLMDDTARDKNSWMQYFLRFVRR